MNSNPTPSHSFVPTKKLSPRELELLTLLNKGYCFKQSAQIMEVKETTTKTLGTRVYKKLGVHNLQSALYEARNHNLLR